MNEVSYAGVAELADLPDVLMPRCWNWQTDMLQEHVLERA